MSCNPSLCCLQEVMGEGEQRDIVGRLLSRISNLQAAAATAEATRRQLHNQMVELRGNVSCQASQGNAARAMQPQQQDTARNRAAVIVMLRAVARAGSGVAC